MSAAEPGRAVVEQAIREPQQPLYARRVTEDGRLWEHSANRMDIGADGAPVFSRQEALWRPRWPLSAERMEELRAAIRDSGAMEVAAEHDAEGVTSDAREVTWTMALDGRTHAVTLRGVPYVSVPEIERLEQGVGRVLQAAADDAREGREGA